MSNESRDFSPLSPAEVKRLAKDAGISWRSIERAKQNAGVVSEPQKDEGVYKIKGWLWRLR